VKALISSTKRGDHKVDKDDDRINWPAIIRHGEDPELTYIPDQSAWLEFTAHDNAGEDDAVIDSAGHQYRIMTGGSDWRLQAPETVTLNELLGLVKAHAAARGSCCVAKLYAPTIQEAIKIVASLEDQ
jgi:hypothetical protein